MIAPRPCPPLLAQILRAVPRRYALPASPAQAVPAHMQGPTVRLAVAIEAARLARLQGQAPSDAVRQTFLEALGQLLGDAVRPERGDPAFQALLLREAAPRVREFASLSAQAERDRRDIRQAVNAIAHPAKQQRLAAGLREHLARWHALATAQAWPALALALQQPLPPGPLDAASERGLARLRGTPALERLVRLAHLAEDTQVRQYRALWDRTGPQPGSAAAAAQGRANQARGNAVEAATASVLRQIAARLNADEDDDAYQVVTSARVPPTLPGSADYAKTEWDAILLRRAPSPNLDERMGWDVCLLAEAKASVDAATTDLPRLTRGLRLLASATQPAYPFDTRQGTFWLRGPSLATLPSDESALEDRILYCCDAPVEPAPRLLGAAHRMQLLSAPASLAYASRLARGEPVSLDALAPVWQQLLSAPAWQSVLTQYARLRQVRALMVHVGDLAATLDGDLCAPALTPAHAPSDAPPETPPASADPPGA